MSKPQVALLEQQVEFITDTQTKFIGLVGGYRAGKTWSLCHKAIYLASRNIGYSGALLEPTQAMLSRVLIPTMDQILREVNLPFTYRASAPQSYTLHFPGGDVRILLMSAENYTRAAGVSLAWFGIDELDLIEKELATASWKMMVSRLTKANTMQGFTTSTPEGYNFLHQYFVEDVEQSKIEGKPLTNRRLIKIRTQDNPFIDEDYVATMRQNYPAKQLQAYLDGDFINLTQGNVYDCFDRALSASTKTVRDFYVEGTMPILHIGMDFNINNMAAVVMCIEQTKSDKLVHAVDELIKVKDTPAMIAAIKAKYPEREGKWDSIIVYPDSSGKSANVNASESSIASLQRAGFRVLYPNKNPSILKERVPAVNAMFKNAEDKRRLFVNINKCPFLTKGLEQQGYKDGAPDKSSGVDHCLDAFGYMLHFNFPIKMGGSMTVYR